MQGEPDGGAAGRLLDQISAAAVQAVESCLRAGQLGFDIADVHAGAARLLVSAGLAALPDTESDSTHAAVESSRLVIAAAYSVALTSLADLRGEVQRLNSLLEQRAREEKLQAEEARRNSEVQALLDGSWKGVLAPPGNAARRAQLIEAARIVGEATAHDHRAEYAAALERLLFAITTHPWIPGLVRSSNDYVDWATTQLRHLCEGKRNDNNHWMDRVLAMLNNELAKSR
jgi:hypothetical protein